MNHLYYQAEEIYQRIRAGLSHGTGGGPGQVQLRQAARLPAEHQGGGQEDHGGETGDLSVQQGGQDVRQQDLCLRVWTCCQDRKKQQV